jgi:hypothetical protein
MYIVSNISVVRLFNVTPSDFDNYGYLLLMKAIIDEQSPLISNH